MRPEQAAGPTDAADTPTDDALSRRRFLRGAALAGGGVVAATVAACAPSVPTPRWTYGPTLAPSQPAAATSPSSPAPSPAASGATLPPGWS